MGELSGRWADDVLSVAPQADPEVVTAAGQDLLARWCEPHRRYHDVRHLQEVLAALDELASAGDLEDDAAATARLAAWFHDAVYETAAAPGANEAASAALASEVLSQLGSRDHVVREVDGLVRMTSDHAVRGDDALQRVFHDADLWILAAPTERFDAYCDQVRDEYASVPDATYRTARSHILRSLVGPDGLYRTAYARGAWEPRARANLERELTRLA